MRCSLTVKVNISGPGFIAQGQVLLKFQEGNKDQESTVNSCCASLWASEASACLTLQDREADVTL